ncbi:MAG TPA: hypothetical protein VF323_06065 [Candidatus Limnocylindrales bacterium]
MNDGVADDRHPDILSFPSADGAFAQFVRATLATVGPHSPDELARAPRPRFPDVVVRLRSLSGEVSTTWYVFRDGGALASG